MKKENKKEKLIKGSKIIDLTINKIHSKMDKMDPTSKEYHECVKDIKDLTEAREKSGLDNKTKAIIAANIGGILLILLHERFEGIITSKAFSMVKKIF